MDLPHVSSEGGPLILGDFDAVRKWRGMSDSADHYDTACRLVERANPSPIALGSEDSVVWDFGRRISLTLRSLIYAEQTAWYKKHPSIGHGQTADHVTNRGTGTDGRDAWTDCNRSR